MGFIGIYPLLISRSSGKSPFFIGKSGKSSLNAYVALLEGTVLRQPKAFES
jgi:hypothetical protein